MKTNILKIGLLLTCILSTNNTWAQPVEAEVREIASQRIEAQIKTIYDRNEMNAVMRAAALGDVATMNKLVTHYLRNF